MTTLEESQVGHERVIAEVQPDDTVLVMFDDGEVRGYIGIEEAQKAVQKRAQKMTAPDEVRVTEVEWR